MTTRPRVRRTTPRASTPRDEVWNCRTCKQMISVTAPYCPGCGRIYAVKLWTTFFHQAVLTVVIAGGAIAIIWLMAALLFLKQGP